MAKRFRVYFNMLLLTTSMNHSIPSVRTRQRNLPNTASYRQHPHQQLIPSPTHIGAWLSASLRLTNERVLCSLKGNRANAQPP